MKLPPFNKPSIVQIADLTRQLAEQLQKEQEAARQAEQEVQEPETKTQPRRKIEP